MKDIVKTFIRIKSFWVLLAYQLVFFGGLTIFMAPLLQQLNSTPADKIDFSNFMTFWSLGMLSQIIMAIISVMAQVRYRNIKLSDDALKISTGIFCFIKHGLKFLVTSIPIMIVTFIPYTLFLSSIGALESVKGTAEKATLLSPAFFYLSPMFLIMFIIVTTMNVGWCRILVSKTSKRSIRDGYKLFFKHIKYLILPSIIPFAFSFSVGIINNLLAPYLPMLALVLGMISFVGMMALFLFCNGYMVEKLVSLSDIESSAL